MTVKQALTILVHGESKAGKSTFSFTGPTPSLILDAEGSTKFINEQGFRSGVPLRKVYWNPAKTAPPRHDGTWDTCVVRVSNWQAIDLAYQHLCVSPHDFRTVTLDSITEVQRKCKANLQVGRMETQHWGMLLDAMDKLIRGVRDLCELPDNPLQVAVFVAETATKDGMRRPVMQGAVGGSLPYWVDICGYLFQEDRLDANGAPTETMVKLLTRNNAQYLAGERVQGKLPPVILNPNISSILNAVYA